MKIGLDHLVGASQNLRFCAQSLTSKSGRLKTLNASAKELRDAQPFNQAVIAFTAFDKRDTLRDAVLL